MIKLTLIITGLATGGAEMMLLKLLQHLDRSRFAPHVISLTTMGEIGPRISALGIPVEAMGMGKNLTGVLAFLRLVRRLRQIKPEVVHTWMYHADLVGTLATRLAGVRTVVWCIRNSDLSPVHSKNGTLAIVKLCAFLSPALPSRIICCSMVAKQIHARYGYAEEKMFIIPNGFDLARFQASSAARLSVRGELGLDMTVPLVGLIARYDSQKNHAGFFRAAGLLHSRMPKVHFVLAGNGLDNANTTVVNQLIEEGIASATHLLGMRNDIPRLMAALDVLVSSSSYGEAFPNVLGEAMACAVPCVVTDVGDSAYIVGDTGRVVLSGDMVGLAAAMDELLSMSVDVRHELGQLARARVENLFDIKKVVAQYEAFYEEMASKGKSVCAG